MCILYPKEKLSTQTQESLCRNSPKLGASCTYLTAYFGYCYYHPQEIFYLVSEVEKQLKQINVPRLLMCVSYHLGNGD